LKNLMARLAAGTRRSRGAPRLDDTVASPRCVAPRERHVAIAIHHRRFFNGL